MNWRLLQTTEFSVWFASLTPRVQDAVAAALVVLERRGPTLGRPLVDRIEGSRHHNMKELRPRIDNVRILFAFDPERAAVLLIGGDKTGRWNAWYRVMIPLADDLFDAHLARLNEEKEKNADGV